MDLSCFSTGVIVEVNSGRDVAAALSDLEMTVHVRPAAGVDVGRDGQQPVAVELRALPDGLALRHRQLLLSGGPAFGKSLRAPLPESSGKLRLPAVPGICGQGPKPAPRGIAPGRGPGARHQAREVVLGLLRQAQILAQVGLRRQNSLLDVLHRIGCVSSGVVLRPPVHVRFAGFFQLLAQTHEVPAEPIHLIVAFFELLAKRVVLGHELRQVRLQSRGPVERHRLSAPRRRENCEGRRCRQPGGQRRGGLDDPVDTGGPRGPKAAEREGLVPPTVGLAVERSRGVDAHAAVPHP